MIHAGARSGMWIFAEGDINKKYIKKVACGETPQSSSRNTLTTDMNAGVPKAQASC
jgi:hypothetical protein